MPMALVVASKTRRHARKVETVVPTPELGEANSLNRLARVCDPERQRAARFRFPLISGQAYQKLICLQTRTCCTASDQQSTVQLSGGRCSILKLSMKLRRPTSLLAVVAAAWVPSEGAIS